MADLLGAAAAVAAVAAVAVVVAAAAAVGSDFAAAEKAEGFQRVAAGSFGQ